MFGMLVMGSCNFIAAWHECYFIASYPLCISTNVDDSHSVYANHVMLYGPLTCESMSAHGLPPGLLSMVARVFKFLFDCIHHGL